MASLDAVGLREMLRGELAARLSPSGWRRIEGPDRSMVLAAFVLPLDDQFAATVEFYRASSFPDRPPVQVSQPIFGVSFEPLRRLWPLLDERVHVATQILDVGELPEHARLCAMEVADPTSLAPVASRLAALANEIAVTGADQWLADVHADLPRLIELVQTARLEVWLYRAAKKEARLAVHVSQRRAGLLDHHTSAAYTPAMLAAQARAELPSIEARLTPLSQNRGYLLEAAIPA